VSGSRLAAIAVVALAGCGASVLIRQNDTTYRSAIDHYQRVRRLVAASLAPEDDQAMFLQGEALYRYRFERPPRSAASYIAQGIAAVIDLPVLDSLSGSLDLYSLRLRSYDGAVHLWETLLERDPTTPLRALTLYRLGWAYRNTQASGLPRDSDKAFDAVNCTGDAATAQLAIAAKATRWKSQDAATAWSIVPGLGQMYVGEYGSGTIRLAIALAAATAVIVPSVVAYERRSDLSWSSDWPLLVTGIVGATVLVSDYSSSYEAATRAVIEYNERREAEFEARHPDAP
jgi:hypothetical protein